MKELLLIPAIFLLSAASVFAQEGRLQIDDPYGTRSPEILYRPSQPVAAGTVRSTRVRQVVYSSPLPSNDNEIVKKTAMVTMAVYDGFAPREVPQPFEPATPTRVSVDIPAIATGKQLAMAPGRYLKGYSTGDLLVDGYILDSSRRYGVDPLLIYAQMNQESSFKPRATSNKGASGLMQLMPSTARRMGVTDIYDPKQNIDGGVKYMQMLLGMFGDVRLALAGYNAGEGAVIKYGYEIPPYAETQEYVRRISARYSSILNATKSWPDRPSTAR